MKKETGRRYLKSALFAFCLLCISMLMSIPVLAAHSTTYNGTDYKLVYDYTYYTSKVTSLKGKSDSTVLSYFVNTGMARGDQAIASFNPVSYRRGNQDLRISYGKQWTKYYTHYMTTGYKSATRKATATGLTKITKPVTTYNGVDYAKVYNYYYYISAHPGVKKAYPDDDVKALKHFVTYGMKAQWQAIKSFDVKSYRYANPALRSLYLDDYAQYYLFYIKNPTKYSGATGVTSLQKPITTYKGKDFSKVFDYTYYTTHYSAVAKYAKSKENNDAAALDYFVKYGLANNHIAKAGVKTTSTAYKNARSIAMGLYPSYFTEEGVKANGYASKTKYLVLVNRGKHQVYVFTGSQGAWTKVKTMPCVVGAASTPTITGVYELKDKGLYFNTGTSARCWYWSRIYMNYLFHSQVYDRSSSPVNVTDARMSVSVSHGCVRLYASDAKWIMDTVPTTSKVVIYN